MTQADDVAGVFADTASVRAGLAAAGYLADDKIAGVVSLAARLGKPLLIEGPAGTGKTQLAKSVAMMADRPLIRLQCYEGIDESKALYEWDYRKQLLWIQAARGDETFSADAVIETGKGIFDERFLLTRPMLEAIRSPQPAVLLVDEVDRVDAETEALFLEVLAEHQVSVPELGRLEARHVPLVFLTSNNTRDLSEALKRRCLFLYLDYPAAEREREIVVPRGPRPRAGARGPARRPRGDPAPPEPEEAAVGLGDHRPGPDAAPARRHRPGRDGFLARAERAAEVPGRRPDRGGRPHAAPVEQATATGRGRPSASRP